MKRLSFLFLLACGSSQADAPVLETPDNDEVSQAIADVEQSPVKKQAIGNCWIYATASWAESQHKAVTGETLNMSESYWTYWHWFDQIARSPGLTTISTGGYFTVTKGLMKKYGWMNEADFIPEEAEAALSQRQASALAAINLVLSEGALKDPAARTRANIRAELDKAWQLNDDVKASLTRAFGASVSRSLNSTSNPASLTGTLIKHTRDVQAYELRPTSVQGQPQKVAIKLSQALDRWQEVGYWGDRRQVQIRTQRALHDGAPVIFTWFVDFAAANAQGQFIGPPATPGRQGGHMVVLEDYEITNVPGFGTLPAGQLVTDQDALNAALDPSAELVFFRVKNSWGAWRPNDPNWLGYHDLYMAYLDADLKSCELDEHGNAIVDQCFGTQTGMTSVLLPRAY